MKDLLTIAVLLVALGGGAWVIYQKWMDLGPDARPALVVEEVFGDVKKADSRGASSPLNEGEGLKEGSRIKTGENSHVSVRVGEDPNDNFKLLDNSETILSRVTADEVQLDIRSGLLDVRLTRFHNRRFVIKSGDNPVRVGLREGQLSAHADGQGSLEVANSSGDAHQITSDGQEIPIPEGQRKVFDPRGNELLAGEIPKSVFLKVEWPEDEVTRKDSATITGQTDPGSLVEVDGEKIYPDETGRFKKSVTLEEGANQVEVKARGLAGTSSEKHQIRRDTRPPKVSSDTKELWK